MARETAQQRREREARAEAQRAAERAAFLEKVPEIIRDIKVRMDLLGISYELNLDSRGRPYLMINYENGSESIYETCLNYDTEEWEFTSIQDKLTEIREAREAAVARFELAKSVFKALKPEEQNALREFINRIF